MNKQYFVYILASKKCGTLYIGITSDLVRRIFEHKNKLADGFTKRHNIAVLVHYEVFDDPVNAIHREKCLKEWQREWKICLIEEQNPDWKDLYKEVTA